MSMIVSQGHVWTDSPMQGPIKGAMTNSAVAGPRRAGGHMSAIVPPPTLKAGLPKTPAKKRQMTTPPILLDVAAPTRKRIQMGSPRRYTISRPADSLSGAPMTGPNANPRQKSEMPRRDTVSETWRS